MKITITSKAVAHIKTIMNRRNCHFGFLLTMKKYGCNGYGYVPDVVNEVPDNAIELSLTPEFRVFIDAKYAEDLNGMTIDYVKKDLGQNQLLFVNPNAEGACGCGESVNLKSRSNG